MLHLPHSDFEKGFTPQELGFPFREIRKIFVGICGDYNYSHSDRSFRNEAAHTHICQNDTAYNSICVINKGFLRESNGAIGNIIWHEYGHIRATRLHFRNCKSHERFINHEELNQRSHGKEYLNIMTMLGRADLAGRYIDTTSTRY